MSLMKSIGKKAAKYLLRFVDIKQSEVRWAGCISILLECFFILISLHSNFFIYESELSSLFQCVITGLISLIGIAIAGVAIVITLFTSEQIRMIEELHTGAFESLLYDFKWFALVATLEAAIYVAMIFVIKMPCIIAPAILFYIVVFLLIYGVFYLLFYGCALIGNCMKLSKIRYTLDIISAQAKNTPVASNEIKLDFLISKLLHSDERAANEFYSELITLIENSTINNKEEIVRYLNERHTKN